MRCRKESAFLVKELFCKFNLITILLASGAGPLCAQQVSSPDKRITVDFKIGTDGEPKYTISREGRTVLADSRLGLVLADADFSRGLKIVSASEVKPVMDRYELASSKRRVNTYKAFRRSYQLESADRQRMDVVFQVSNDGVVFRYEFPEKSSSVRKVTNDLSSFHFPTESKAWLTPMTVAKSGWKRVNPAYEEHYEKEIPVGKPSNFGAGWAFPALFRTGETWVILTETGVARGYCGSRLAHESPDGEYRIAFPDARETIDGEPTEPSFKTPYRTPWRVIALGSLKTVVESSLGTDVADPAIKIDKLAGPPGKSSWSWGKMGDSNTTYEVQRQFVDLAAEMGWAYCLVDALWDVQIGYDKMKELSDYARSKKVSLIVWYNSNGSMNDVIFTPKDVLNTAEGRRKEFARLKEMGIAGVKIDFFGGDGRAVMDYYLDLVEDAAKFGILVNFHGCTVPRGLSRTYPNLMTSEAVRAYEHILMQQADADKAPPHMAMMPFTRNVFDPMDFTPVSLTPLPSKKLRTTFGAELATAVLFTSGLQHYVETPEGIRKQPDFVIDVLKTLPNVWEDSRFLSGYPGKLAVIARQGADGRWWIAGLNGEDAPKTIEVSLAELGKKSLKSLNVITDDDSGALTRSDVNLEGETQILRIVLKPNGGFVAVAP